MGISNNLLGLQWAIGEREKIYPGEWDKSINFYQGAAAAEQHVEGQPQLFHKETHKEATDALRNLFIGLRAHPSSQIQGTNIGNNVPIAIRDPIQRLEKLNLKIKQHNTQQNLDSELGVIRYQQLCGMWRAVISIGNQPEVVNAQLAALRDLCGNFHYPQEWADIPIATQSPPGSQGTFPTQESLASHFGPQEPSSARNSNNPAQQNQQSMQLHYASSGGAVRAISLIPRRVSRSVTPGYTSTGDKIRMIQYLGMSARLVVEDANGKIRLVSSAAAGGPLAVEQAKATGVPSTIRDEKDVKELRDQVRNTSGGTYGLNWVAVGEISVIHNKTPYIVVGFFFEGPGGNPPLREVGISRSSLKKIISPKAADRLIAEAMTYNPDATLSDTISGMSGLSLGMGPVPNNLLPPTSTPPYLGWQGTMTQQSSLSNRGFLSEMTPMGGTQLPGYSHHQGRDHLYQTQAPQSCLPMHSQHDMGQNAQGPVLYHGAQPGIMQHTPGSMFEYQTTATQPRQQAPVVQYMTSPEQNTGFSSSHTAPNQQSDRQELYPRLSPDLIL